jgi:glycosyltransferase involved in cell wall biosynthesis
MTIPEVSVVMSVYNGAQSLRASVASVLAQEGVELELIVVDDGSTDASARVLDEMAASDARVRVLHQENLGLTRALIRGCAAARGTYIARQDAGDCLLDRRLELQHRAMEADKDLSFVSCWTEFCGPGGEFLWLAKGTGRAASPVRIISENAKHRIIDGPSSHGSVMFRRDRYERAGGYRPQFYFGQDWDLWYRLAESGKFQMIREVLYRARVTPESLSGKHRDEQNALGRLSRQALMRRMHDQRDDDLLIQAAGIRPGPDCKISTRTRADALYFIGEQLRRNGDARAVAYLRRSLDAAPFDLRPLVRLAQLGASRLLGRKNPAKAP